MSRAQHILTSLQEAKNRRQAYHDKMAQLGGDAAKRPLQPGLVNQRDFLHQEPVDPEWERQYKFHPARRKATPRHYLETPSGQPLAFPERPYYDNDEIMRGGQYHNEPYDVRPAGMKDYKWGKKKSMRDYDKGGTRSMSGADLSHTHDTQAAQHAKLMQQHLDVIKDLAARRAADVERMKAATEKMKKERG